MNIKTSTCLVLLLLLNLVASEWIDQQEIGSPYCLDTGPCYTFHRHDASKTTHLAYCGKDDQGNVRLFYFRILDDNTTVPVALDSVHDCRFADITGGGDELLIAEGARKVSGPTDGRSDVFYLISKDGGKTWTVPAPVARKDANDANNRTNPSALYVKETGRVWIFYSLQTPEGRAIAASSRAPGSLVFSNERKLNIQYTNAAYYPKAAYTFAAGSCVLHLAWTEYVGTSSYNMKYLGRYTYSPDSGISWNQPRDLAPSFYVGVTSILTFGQSTVYLVYNNITEFGQMYLAWSSNGGKDWEKRVRLPGSGAPESGVALCTNPSGEEPTLFVMTNDYFKNVNFGIFNVASGEYRSADSCFHGLTFAGGPILSCYYDSDFTVLASIESSNSRAGISLYFSRYIHHTRPTATVAAERDAW